MVNFQVDSSTLYFSFSFMLLQAIRALPYLWSPPVFTAMSRLLAIFSSVRMPLE